MRWSSAAAAALCSAALCAPDAAARPPAAPLYDPVMLNIGLLCQWQIGCMQMQNGAMQRSVKFVRRKRPPTWRVELCNRNASRRRQRVDWVGFENCIRNPRLRPTPAFLLAPRAHRMRITG